MGESPDVVGGVEITTFKCVVIDGLDMTVAENNVRSAGIDAAVIGSADKRRA